MRGIIGKNRRAEGFAAEDIAAAYLQKHNCRILQRNYQIRFGEVDIIAEDDGDIIFVEVRKRGSIIDAAASITPSKQKKLRAAAAHYLAKLPFPAPCRFDAILTDGKGNIKWLKNAFLP